MVDLLDGSLADPRTGQRRIAVTPSGRQAWIDISGDDRLGVINQLPSRWPEVIKARERGDSLEQIARWVKCPPPCSPSCRFRDETDEAGVGERVHVGPECLSYLISECYNHIETKLHDLAQRRARLLP